MKKYLLLFIICLSIKCFAQQNKVEELQNKLKTYLKEDTLRALLFIDLADLTLYSDNDGSEEYALNGLALSKKLNWKIGIAAAEKSVGNVHYQRGDYVKALESWQQSFAAAEKENNKQLAASVLGNIGLVYQQMRDYKKAIEYQKQKLAMIAPFNNKLEIAYSNINIGNAYMAMEDFDSGLKYYQAALAIGEELDNARVKAYSHNAIGMVYKNKKDNDKALKHLEEALIQSEKAKDTSLTGYVKNNLSLLQLAKKNYEKSEALNQEALLIAKKTRNRQLESEGHQYKSKIYVEKDDYKKALESFISHKKISDSIAGDEKNKEITRREVQFEADKKQAIAIEEIKYQKKLRNYGIASAALLTIAAIISFIFYKKHRDSIQRQKELLYKADVADTDMRILRLQMNPHFIFNSLNSISDYINKHNIQAADYYLSKFAKLMRGILEHSEEKEIPLSDELNILSGYMDLEAARLSNRFTYTFQLEESIDPDNTYIPPLLLQPFVENSIWHGFAGKESGGLITIGIKKDDNLLICTVDDNGSGSEKTQPTKKSHGIRITKERLALIDPRSSIEIVSSTLGTRVEIRLPLQEEI